MINIATLIAVLSAFSFTTVASSELSLALRGSRGLTVNENIDIFLCDANNDRISSKITNKTEELEGQGYDVRVCFEATRLATTSNLFILKVDDFTFTKDRTNGDLAAAGPTSQLPAILRQTPVDHGVALSDDFTEIFCEPGARVCALETRLTGFFFLTSGIIRGKGSLLMQRGTNSRRELQSIANFQDVYIEIQYTGGGNGTPLPPGRKRVIIIVSVIAGILVTLMGCGVVFCCFAGICCFGGRDKDEEHEPEDIEEVSWGGFRTIIKLS